MRHRHNNCIPIDQMRKEVMLLLGKSTLTVDSVSIAIYISIPSHIMLFSLTSVWMQMSWGKTKRRQENENLPGSWFFHKHLDASESLWKLPHSLPPNQIRVIRTLIEQEGFIIIIDRQLLLFVVVGSVDVWLHLDFNFEEITILVFLKVSPALHKQIEFLGGARAGIFGYGYGCEGETDILVYKVWQAFVVSLVWSERSLSEFSLCTRISIPSLCRDTDIY